jgi:pectinesterase
LIAAAAAAPPRPVKIVLVGDSTVTDEAGWGTGFRARLAPGVECVNLSKGGRSSMSYINEGWWRKALSERSDYILIQFGHNDAPGKGPDRETVPDTTFLEYMARYVDEARAAGASPVLVTSLTRRMFDPGGQLRRDTLVNYSAAVRKLAAAKNVPMIDLFALSVEVVEKAGPKGSESLGRMMPDGSGGEKLDTTHLGPKGAALFGGMVAAELAKVVPDLASYIRREP